MKYETSRQIQTSKVLKTKNLSAANDGPRKASQLPLPTSTPNLSSATCQKRRTINGSRCSMNSKLLQRPTAMPIPENKEQQCSGCKAILRFLTLEKTNTDKLQLATPNREETELSELVKDSRCRICGTMIDKLTGAYGFASRKPKQLPSSHCSTLLKPGTQTKRLQFVAVTSASNQNSNNCTTKALSTAMISSWNRHEAQHLTRRSDIEPEPNNNRLIQQQTQMHLEDFVLAWNPSEQRTEKITSQHSKLGNGYVLLKNGYCKPGSEYYHDFYQQQLQLQRNNGVLLRSATGQQPTTSTKSFNGALRTNGSLAFYQHAVNNRNNQQRCECSQSSSNHGSKHHRRTGSHSASPRHSRQAVFAAEVLPSFPTNFARILKECPPPMPPLLLRCPPVQTVARGKDWSGKVKVTLRVFAPPGNGSSSSHSPDHSFLSVDARKKQVMLHDMSFRKQPGKLPVPKIFGFDAVFSPEDSQTEVCSSALIDVLQTVVGGADGCLFCFGQANLGKTYTLTGSDKGTQNLGVIPCALSWLYRLMNEMKQKSATSRFSARISALEISGPDEELRDLLAEYVQGTDQVALSAVCLKDDPVSGTSLMNLSELRAETPEKAAHFLDAALAARNTATEDDRRNSHLFFTIHVYQYKMNLEGNGEVAGGRSRLHLIDLGSGEKTSKPGRATLTLPALGAVILTLLQGQKHVPYKNSKLCQLLKAIIGSAMCRFASVIACVSSDAERYRETTNTILLASRIHKIKSKSRGKFGMGSSGGSHSGESSCDEKGVRRRFRRSASDPDCTSSSEQSCDTVIYVGGNDPRFSDKDLTDGEGPPTRLPIMPNSSHSAASKENLKSDKLPSVSETSPISYPSNNNCFQRNSALSSVPCSSSSDLPNTKSGPAIASAQLRSVADRNSGSVQELWIDGPNAITLPMSPAVVLSSPAPGSPRELWIDGPPAKMDPRKREMVKQWVILLKQEQQARSFPSADPWKDSWLMKQPNATPKTYADSSNLATEFSEESQEMYTCNSASASMKSMETSSENIVETVDAAVQIEEHQIDAETGGIGTTLTEEEFAWAVPEPTQRFLEDIVEVEEDLCSENRSNSASIDLSIYRNEALATLDNDLNIDDQQHRPSRSAILAAARNNKAFEEHPLRVLSREHLDTAAHSDTISFTTDNMDALSLPDTDQLDNDEPMNDEDLEQAMRASLTSIRSTEILAKLKSEMPKLQSPNINIAADLPGTSRMKRPTDLNGNCGTTGKRHQNQSSLRTFGPVPIDNLFSNTLIPDCVTTPTKLYYPSTSSGCSNQASTSSSFQSKPVQKIRSCAPEESEVQKILDSEKPSGGRSDLKPPSASRRTNENLLVQPTHLHEKTPPPSVALLKSKSDAASATLKMPVPTKSNSKTTTLSKSSISSDVVGNHVEPATKQQPVNSESMSLSQSHDSGRLKGIGPMKVRSPSIEKSMKDSVQQPPQNPSPKLVPAKQDPVCEVKASSSGFGFFARSSTRSSKGKGVEQKAANGAVAGVCVEEKRQCRTAIVKTLAEKKQPLKSNENCSTSITTANGKTSCLPSPAPVKLSRKPQHEKQQTIVDEAPAIQESSKTKQKTGSGGLRSPILSFLRSPTKVHKNDANSKHKRNSSGYDSGHDSGIGEPAKATSPEMLSPYHKVTKPRNSQRSSSGHGSSDNSSVVSSDCTPAAGRKGLTLSFLSGKSRNRDSVAVSSGYESAGGYVTKAELRENSLTSPDSGSDSSCSYVRSPPSCKFTRKQFNFTAVEDVNKSRSAPQSPSTSAAKSANGRLYDSQLIGKRSQAQTDSEKRALRKQLQELARIKRHQEELKTELLDAKKRLGIPQSKWSYELHVEACMDAADPNIVEALQQETKILEKRVAACKAHVLMITVFDCSVPAHAL